MTINTPQNFTTIFDTTGAPIRPTIADAGLGMQRVDWSVAGLIKPTMFTDAKGLKTSKYNTGAYPVYFQDTYGFSFASLASQSVQSSFFAWLRDYSLCEMVKVNISADTSITKPRGSTQTIAEATGFSILSGEIDFDLGRVYGIRATTSPSSIGATSFHVMIDGYVPST